MTPTPEKSQAWTRHRETPSQRLLLDEDEATVEEFSVRTTGFSRLAAASSDEESTD